MPHTYRTASVNVPSRRSRCAAGLLLLVCLSGCRATSQRWTSAIAHYDSAQPDAALSELDAVDPKTLEASGRIDRAVLQLMTGDLAQSEVALLDSRHELQFLSQQDFTEQTRSMLTDDKALAWSGREYERRMVDALAILASLAGNRQDAFAHAAQAMELVYQDLRQQQPSEHARSKILVAGYEDGNDGAPRAATSTAAAGARHAPNALVAYLHALLSSESALNADVVERDLRQLSYWAPEARISAPLGTQTKRRHGTLHVVTFCGRITRWEPETAAPTSASLLLADQILSAVGDHSLPPTIAPVQIARPVQRRSLHPFRTTVRVASQSHDSVQQATSLVDLNAAAFDSYQHDRDKQIARAVARRIVKKGTVYAAKDQLSVAGGSEIDLLLNAGGIIWEALEKPDLRQIRCLPSLVEAIQVELPVGEHQVELGTGSRLNPQRVSSPAVVQSVTIEDGRNTVLLCFRPSDQSPSLIVANPQH